MIGLPARRISTSLWATKLRLFELFIVIMQADILLDRLMTKEDGLPLFPRVENPPSRDSQFPILDNDNPIGFFAN